VKDFFEPYAKPQDMANREDVSWVALRDKSGSGVLFAGLGKMSATVLPYTADELAAAAHPTDLPANPDRTRIDLDATVLGISRSSYGPIPIERDIVKAGAAHHFGFVIRPLGAQAETGSDRSDAAELARVSSNETAPVLVTVDELCNRIALTTATPGAKIRYSLNGEPARDYAGPLDFDKAVKLSARAEKTGLAPSVVTAAEIAVPKKRAKVVVLSASSEKIGEGEAAKIADGNPDSYWHTNYGRTVSSFPHSIDFDLVESTKLSEITQLPRQDGKANGRIKKYEISVSADRKEWKVVKTGQFANSASLQTVKLDQPVTARFVRFTALSEQKGAAYASSAEISFIIEITGRGCLHLL
jgi:beta-galactosidase